MARLISQLERLEAGAAARAAAAPIAVGISWTSAASTVVDPETLRIGEYIAVDVDVHGGPEECEGIPSAMSSPPATWVTAERVTRDPGDLGIIRRGGVRIGRVVMIDGGTMRVEADAGGVWPGDLSPSD
jgi:hypothetical protein